MTVDLAKFKKRSTDRLTTTGIPSSPDIQSMLSKVHRGQQVGAHMCYSNGDGAYWLLLALQLYKGEYLAHIACIEEKDMASENFRIYRTTAHRTLNEAVAFLRLHSPIPFDFNDFSTFKGQKAFYPEGEEIDRPQEQP